MKREEYLKEYYKKNKKEIYKRKKEYNQRPEIIIQRKESIKLYYENNQDKIRNRNYKKNFGISIEEYNNLFIKQEGKCAICGTHQSLLSKKLSVDHNHKTNAIRGLLCQKCNTGIGLLQDDIKILEQAILYLQFNDNSTLEIY